MRRYLSIVLILTGLILSCSTDEKKDLELTWSMNMLYPDQDSIQVDSEKINCKEFINKFEEFPWMEWPNKNQESQSDSQPIMSVKDGNTSKVLWISIESGMNDPNYLIGYSYLKKKEGFLGFGKTKQIPWCEIYLTTSEDLIKECVELFFDRNYEEFENRIRKLEAKNLL